ncbi:methionine gamma-lyase family protein [Peptoniphilus sp. GNH]|nr:aluminum resistance protein [Clostridiales bacterium KA00134]UHR02932.1 methionine gamma-lyase family protein [Peptoniphilus sp. GNH]
MKEYKNLLKESYGIKDNVIDFVSKCESELIKEFREIEEISQYNQVKILNAMQEEKLQATDFNWTTGYGYGDEGREKTERIYRRVFKTEDALVRQSIVSGTHAISLALAACLKSKDHMLAISGRPYDTLLKVIGIKGNERGSLMDNGIEYSEIDLKDNLIDVEAVKKSIRKNTKLLHIQRSIGYGSRRALLVSEIGDAIKEIRKFAPNVIIFVDNCYGEFTDIIEPSEVGADIMAGSLIKNPGGGLALSGGYVVGRKDLINACANRLTAPGIGKECGLSYGQTRRNLQGFFMAPQIVENSIKTVLLFAKAFNKLGFETMPKLNSKRSDIVLAIKFNEKDKMVNFCRSLQEASPVDSHFIPCLWDMPGYSEQVIMAAGDFIEGSSIELSADGPDREPYYAYLQGGLTYMHGRFALEKVLEGMKLL